MWINDYMYCVCYFVYVLKHGAYCIYECLYSTDCCSTFWWRCCGVFLGASWLPRPISTYLSLYNVHMFGIWLCYILVGLCYTCITYMYTLRVHVCTCNLIMSSLVMAVRCHEATLRCLCNLAHTGSFHVLSTWPCWFNVKTTVNSVGSGCSTSCRWSVNWGHVLVIMSYCGFSLLCKTLSYDVKHCHTILEGQCCSCTRWLAHAFLIRKEHLSFITQTSKVQFWRTVSHHSLQS